MRTHYRAFADLSSYFHQNSTKFSYKKLQHCDKHACVHSGSSMMVHALIVLLSRASPHPASCFPAQLIVRYLQFEIRHYNVQNSAQMRTISSVWSACGPSPQLRTFMEALYVGLNLGLWLASLADSKTRIAGAGESCLALLYRYAALDCKVKCVIVPVGN